MKLEISDRGTGEERLIDSKINGECNPEFYSEIRRLAGILGRPISEVQESLVCGNTYRTNGAFYVLID